MELPAKILVYDDDCPLCTWYSSLFVRLGLLKPENRVAFTRADPSLLTAIDMERAVDEIPLFDPATRHTLYGIDALLEILGWKIPWIKRAGRFGPLKWGLTKLYKLVSYNRKVIIARKCRPGTFDCSPGFNPVYRIAFLLIFLVANTVMLLPLHEQLFSHLSIYHLTSGQLQAGHLVFVAVNCTIALLLERKPGLEYLGQINMLALLSILLLTALMSINRLLILPEWAILLFLALLTTLVGKEYFRRMRYAEILGRYRIIVVINILCLIAFMVYVFQ